jgi:hypothetical protein
MKAPRFYHSVLQHADFVTDGVSVLMVPGSYDPEADSPPQDIAMMFGYPFDLDEWRINMNGQWFSAADLRQIATVMDDTKEVYDRQKGGRYYWDIQDVRGRRCGRD